MTPADRITALEVELAEAKAEIERLADSGCHLEMLLAAMKARGDGLAEALELSNGALSTEARQALTEWRDQ